jgi:hypothetical protein
MKNVFVSIERSGEALRENVYDVVVRVRTVVEVGAESRLPFLCLHGPVSVRRVVDETLKVQFAHTCELGANFEIGVGNSEFRCGGSPSAGYSVSGPIFTSWGLHFHLMGSPFSLKRAPFSFQTLSPTHITHCGSTHIVRTAGNKTNQLEHHCSRTMKMKDVMK